ncbi:MAG: glutaredoxin domain-containing protein [Rubripirellula sp.]|nr:glutaredoxin domain-containing protein [Rubripirellula sp.]
MNNMRLLFLLVGVCGASLAAAQPPQRASAGLVRLEVFVRSDSDLTENTVAFAKKFVEQHKGIELVVHDVIQHRDQLARLWQITKRSNRAKPVVPAFYCCDRLYFGYDSPDRTELALERLLTVDVYTRATCPKCIKAKAFIKKLKPSWPALRFQIHDVSDDAAARGRWQAICRTQGKPPGLPTIDFGGRVIIGYQGDDITGVEFENLIHRVTTNQHGNRETSPAKNDSSSFLIPLHDQSIASIVPPWLSLVAAIQPPPGQAVDAESPVESGLSNPSDVGQVPETELLLDDLLLPEDAGSEDVGEVNLSTSDASAKDGIDVPLLGELRATELGFPLFTFLVGLIDGFTPCAMWILVFLLSVLVNIRDRRKILLIAGTFIFVSGAAYFIFMTAWLNLLILVGIGRRVQIALGVLALLIGVVNVKDFFAFKKGISFSIPESAKPGLYRRVREIIAAKYLTAALTGVVLLAVIVNMVEMICTAGLPALYAQVLTMQEFPAWKNYAFLGLYISAYMLDDTVLLVIVVATLSHRRLQEREGRWLKLLSGLVILALGLVMIFKPEWLQLGQ